MVFDDMIADSLNNKKLYPIVTKLFTRARKLNMSHVLLYMFLFCCIKKYWTEFFTIFYCKNSK